MYQQTIFILVYFYLTDKSFLENPTLTNAIINSDF